MSGLTKGNVAEYVSQYPAKDGSTRTLVQGFPVQLISGFVAGTLAKLPNAAKERAVVVDDNGRVIASADPKIKIGSPAPKAGKDREETDVADRQRGAGPPSSPRRTPTSTRASARPCSG